MKKRRPVNVAGMMGKMASQPSQGKREGTVDPLERLEQKRAGRMEGGNKPNKRKSLMFNYGMS